MSPATLLCRPAYLTLTILLITTLLHFLPHIAPITVQDLLDLTLQHHILDILPTTSPPSPSRSANPLPPLRTLYAQIHHSSTPTFLPNKHIKPLTQCRTPPNLITAHIRLPHPLQPISFALTNDTTADQKSWFNPTLIPLPATHSVDDPQYLLLTRLVTQGNHQESHYCFAGICSPHSNHTTSRPGERECTTPAIDISTPLFKSDRGSGSVMHCLTEPKPLRIPPTPARKCSGKWMPFTQIPGFHDPRVFWGGGMPLVVVNSGSMAGGGCVGLWVQDLRGLVVGLEDVMERGRRGRVSGSDYAEGQGDLVSGSEAGAATGPARRKREVILTSNAGNNAQDGQDGWDGIFKQIIQPKVLFQSITEITRNPASDRREVEKNWAVFFPMEGEAVVQYELMGDVVPSGDESDGEGVSDKNEGADAGKVDEAKMDEGAIDRGGGFSGMDAVQTRGQKRWLNDTLRPANDSAGQWSSTSTADDATNAVQSPSAKTTGGRTLAELYTHGRTSPNITSPLEQPCFDLMSFDHTHDSLNNTGHWHQGSNSLRLVLSTRTELRSVYDEYRALPQQRGDSAGTYGNDGDAEQFEDWLIDDGRIVHFSIMHRKFVNEWKLPMRYERYFVVWEARWPYRIVGVSHWPVLFDGERARPWSRKEDLEDGEVTHDGFDAEEKSTEQVRKRGQSGHEVTEDEAAYFTYSPSIAWAWRPTGDDDEGPSVMLGGATSPFGDLGTGYLGDGILIGVGIDDRKQAFVRVPVDEVLQCLRLCAGVDPEEQT